MDVDRRDGGADLAEGVAHGSGEGTHTFDAFVYQFQISGFA